MTNQRPTSILWFERLYFLSLGISTVEIIYYWSQEVELMAVDLGSERIAAIALVILWIVVLLFSLAIWFYIAIKARPWAKWVQVILTALACVSVMFEILFFLLPGVMDAGQIVVNVERMLVPDHWTAFYFVSILATVAATMLLFRSDSVDWFEQERPNIENVFD